MLSAEDLTCREMAAEEFWENALTAAIIWMGEGY